MTADNLNNDGYNLSAIALSYGFVDYFDDRSFGSANWDQPTTVNPSRLGSSSQLVTATPFVVTVGIAALMLRFFSRTRFHARLWWDDLFAVLAGLFLTASQLIFIRIVYLGRASLNTMLQTTKEWEQERVERISVGLKLYMSFELLYIFSSFFIKYSFLFLYLRISQETKSIKWFLRGAFLVTTLSFFFCILALFLTCMPISDFWDITHVHSQPTCERKILLSFGTGVSNIVTDAIVLAILVPLLMQASLSKAQIRGVVCLYICGALVIIASGLRFATQLMDVSMLQSMGWSLLEVSLALILLCAPMCAKLLSAPLIQETGCPVKKRNHNFNRRYSSSPFDKNLPAPPPVLGGPKQRRGGPGRTARLVKEISSPMYKRLKVGRRETINGRTVWEVQPQSATTAATEATARQMSESPLPPLPRTSTAPVRV
ncbi:hypothetical protein ABW21_db0203203 [Orbilia brochopaga]|nr:hypothetical protein ABW21_db0203203 [Drechslerella brochopaga]